LINSQEPSAGYLQKMMYFPFEWCTYYGNCFIRPKWHLKWK